MERSSLGKDSAVSTSKPIDATSTSRAATAPQKPSQWLMLPTIPFGQIGALSGPRGTAAASSPRDDSARRAAVLPAANSRLRFGAQSAVPIASSPTKGASYMEGVATPA